jgi:hypothetical protein
MSKHARHINGVLTDVGHYVEYVDDRPEPDGSHKKHLALVKSIKTGKDGKHHANLHVFHEEGHTSHEIDVPHDVHEAPHTWDHHD